MEPFPIEKLRSDLATLAARGVYVDTSSWKYGRAEQSKTIAIRRSASCAHHFRCPRGNKLGDIG